MCSSRFFSLINFYYFLPTSFQCLSIFYFFCLCGGSKIDNNYVFYNEIPGEFPLIREIEHQIDLVPSALIPNRQAYQNNPLETKEFKKHVKE